MGVVDALEVIDVHHEQARAGPLRRLAVDELLQGGVESAAIHQPGERVDQRLVLRLHQGLAQVVDLPAVRSEPILQRAHGAAHAGGPVHQLAHE